MSISKIKEINKKWDKFTIYYNCKWNNCPEGGKECYHANKENIKEFWNQQILSLIEELEGKVIGEDEHKYIPSVTEPQYYENEQTRNELRKEMRASIKSYKKGL